MRHLTTALRIFLGLAFLTFGLNYFFNFLPAPSTPPPPEALAFLGPFAASGYLTLVKGIEVAAGLLLLSGRFVPLALALLAPIIVGIVAFHVLLAPAGTALPVVLAVVELALAWAYRNAFAPMLAARVVPAGFGARAATPAAREHDLPHAA